MSALELLALHAANRDAWLRETVDRLEGDERLAAGWLVGSMGSGSADELSDIDLVVVTGDSHADDVLQHAVQEVSRFGATAWLLEVPANAPRGGAYLTAGFKSTPLPIAIDWYWQPRSQALFPSDGRLLFDKAGVPAADPPASFAELMSRRELRAGPNPDHSAPSDADRVAFFWAMVPVAAKYGARGWNEKADRILLGLDEQVDALRAARASRQAHPGPTSPLQRLRLLMHEMDQLMPELQSRGISTPDTTYAEAFMRLAEDLRGEGWSRSVGRSVP